MPALAADRRLGFGADMVAGLPGVELRPEGRRAYWVGVAVDSTTSEAFEAARIVHANYMICDSAKSVIHIDADEVGRHGREPGTDLADWTIRESAVRARDRKVDINNRGGA